MTIISQIRASLAHVTPSQSVRQFYSGMIYKKSLPQDFTTLTNSLQTLGTSDAMLGILLIHYLMKNIGYQNDNSLKFVLDNMGVINGIPHTNPNVLIPNGGFLVYHTSALALYKYATDLSYRTDKWILNNGYNNWKLDSRYQFGGVLITNGTEYISQFRTYDESLETMRCFLEFWILYGIPDALATAKILTDTVLETAWSKTLNIFQYHFTGGEPSMETESAGIWALLTKLDSFFNFATNYQSKIDSDAWNKFLINAWASPLWNGYNVDHVPLRHESRGPETAMTALMFQSFYPTFSASTQARVRAMLLGSGYVRWFSGFTNTSIPETLFDATTNMFRENSVQTPSPTADGTAIALLTMFAQGIIPNSSYLKIALNNEVVYPSHYFLRPDVFSLDPVNNILRLAVSKGSLQLYFGDNPVTAIFSAEGVYDIQLDASWNTIQNITYVRTVPTDIYPKPSSTFGKRFSFSNWDDQSKNLARRVF